jgi:AcrR family transcriptional regulator
MPPDRRTRKRLATRQGISDAATRLFVERGFDNVTVDEIAEAADVGRMTVFNHFPRKEDMFFDRDEEGRETLRNALRHRDAGVSPIEALRLLARRTASEDPLYVHFSPETKGFVETIEKSPTLIARARAIRDELTHVVMVALVESAGQEATDPDAQLAANLLLATWTVAFIRAHRTYRESRNAGKAKSVFLALIERGSRGIEAAMAGTPYAQPAVQKAATPNRAQRKRESNKR